MMWILVVVLVIVCLLLVFRLKQQQERVSALYKSDKLKSHFVKSLVYEIRNPLQSVMKLAEMVGRKDLRQETGQGVFVSADRHIVELVLNKLVVLACRFTKKGEITVGCRYEEDSHRLTFVVQDTGGGIPEGRGDALFNWYNDPDDVFDETEIDLSVSQKLASKVGGLLHWDETYKNGTRIEFILPVR